MVLKGKYWFGNTRTRESRHALTAAATTLDNTTFVAPFRCKIVKCSIITDSTLTGQATNYCTLKFVNKGSVGTGSDIIASTAFSLAPIVATAFDEFDLGAVANNVLNEGDVVSFAKAVTSGGLATPELLSVLYEVRI